MNKVIKGTIALLAIATIWGFLGAYLRFLKGMDLNVWTIYFFASLFGALNLFIISKWKKDFRLPQKTELPYLILAALTIFGTSAFLFFGYTYSTIANTLFLHYTSPVITAALAFLLLKEKVNKWRILALGLSLVGIALILNIETTGLIMAGNLFAFASAFTFSGTVLIGRKLKGCSARFTAFWSMFFVALFFFPLFLFMNTLTNIMQILIIFAVSGIIINSLGLSLYYYGLRFVEAAAANLLLLFEILVGVFVGIIFYGEILSSINLIGGLLIFTGCVIVILSKVKKSK